MDRSTHSNLFGKRAYGQLISLLALCLFCVADAPGQILQGQWVDRSNEAIDQHRKTGVTVIVLDDADRAVRGAEVVLTQRRHDFALGLTLPTERMPPRDLETLPVYRCFNAVGMQRFTDWSAPAQTDPQAQAQRLSAWIQAIDPIEKNFGSVVSADPARNHDRLTLLQAIDLRDALLARIDLACQYDPTPTHYDLYTDLIKQDLVERKLGQGMLSRMFDRADARRTDASFGVAVRNTISLQAGRSMVNAIQRLEVRQVPFEHVTIQQQFRGPIQPNALRRMLDEYVAPLPVPVTLAGLEVGAPTPVAAAIKLETLVRLAFAEPNIDGLYFAGLLDDELLEPNAALIDRDGRPTAAGEVLDALFYTVWRSKATGTTDERGNVAARVFTGWYNVIATLPNGTRIESEVYVPKHDRTKRVILQATAAEAQ